MSARRSLLRLEAAAVRAGAACDEKRSLEPQSPCGGSVVEPRRKFSKVALSGGREGLEVRAGLTEGSGLGLFAGSRGIPPGGFIALHRGVWQWTGGSGDECTEGGAYAISLDNWHVVTPVRPGVGWVCKYPAARINEPAPGMQGNAFAKTWYDRPDRRA